MEMATISRRLGWLRANTSLVHGILFAAILGIAVFARTWEYQRVPGGLNVDEASIGVDAYDIAKYGTDRNGVSYPVEFIAFGQEQNVLYGYLLAPLVGTFGLRTSVVRLPMLFLYLLTLPVVYLAVKRHFGANLALWSMFVLAISPWHIMASRWALDVNSMAVIMTLGFACLLEASRDNRWFLIACFILGLSFYTYGPSYFITPFLLLTATALLLRKRVLSWPSCVAGLVIFVLMAIPIVLFLVVNTFKLDAIHVGAITIPRLPTATPRFLSATQGLQDQLGTVLVSNLKRLFNVLVLQTDFKLFNVVDPYGYFYGITFPLVLVGMGILAWRARVSSHIGSAIVLLWLAACFIFAVLQPVNINRINAVFIPLLITIAVALEWCGQKYRGVTGLSVGLLTIAFVAFNVTYHSSAYLNQIAQKFRPGLVQAIGFASMKTDGPVCVTDEPGQPYIFVLFSEQLAPSSYLANTIYASSPDAERRVQSMGRYTFGKQACPLQPLPAYVLVHKEIPPQLGNRYRYEFFEDYVVYYPSR